MILYLSITAITVLLLGISFRLQSEIQWTAWLMVCALWAVLSAAILIPGGPLRPHDAAQTARATPAPCCTAQLGGPQRRSDTRNSLHTRWHQRVARHYVGLGGGVWAKQAEVIGTSNQDRELIVSTLKRNLSGKRSNTDNDRQNQ